MGFPYWNGDPRNVNFLTCAFPPDLRDLSSSVEDKLCPLSNTCMGDTQCWALMLLVRGKAVGHLLSILSFFLRGILLLPSSSSAQSSVVCSSSIFLFSISTGVFLPPVPLWFFLPVLPPLLNSRVFQNSFLFYFEISCICPGYLLVIPRSALSWEESNSG